MNFIDRFLNSITMYRLVLYALLLLAAFGIVLGFLGRTGFSGTEMILSLGVLFMVCFGANAFFAKIFGAFANDESYAITGLILFLIMPAGGGILGASYLALAGFLAIASKYILTWRKKHIFNPAAVSAVILGFLGLVGATWWVGSVEFLPLTALLGFLVVRKLRRFTLFFAFLFSAIVFISVFVVSAGNSFVQTLQIIFTSWPVIFFGSIMLTEPFTTPPHRSHQAIYGLLTGFFFGAIFDFGFVYSTPELALVLGNVYSYFVSSPQRLVLRLKKITEMAPLLYDFEFEPSEELKFKPGQYMEWTIVQKKSDSRGNRRYFTIASSPTEKNIHIGVKVPPNSSAFKQSLASMQEGSLLSASSLSGDFVLPKDPKVKIAALAGGIGITPFRSMVKYLTDKKEKRDFTLFYASANAAEYGYKEIFKTAEDSGVKTVYVLSGSKETPLNWQGRVGYIDEKMLKEEMPDYQERMYYLSGPNVMVEAYKKLLLSLGIARRNIITDYFPGY